MKKVFYTIFFTLFAAGAIYLGLVWIKSGTISPTLDFNVPEEILVGVPFELEIGVGNDSGQILNDVVISLASPPGMAFIGRQPEEGLISKKLGNLGVGSLTSEIFKLIATEGEPGSIKQIKLNIAYSPESLDSKFEKKEKIDIRITGPAVKMKIAVPDQLNSGERLELKVSYENSSEADLDGLFLEAEYPEAFQYQKSTINPDTNDNYWFLGGLHKGSSGSLSIIGRLVGQENTSHIFKIKLGARLEEESYIIGEQIISVSIKTAPVTLSITANNVSEYVANPGDSVNYKISYSYLREPPAGQAVLTAKLTGEMFESGAPLRWDIPNPSKSGEVNFTAMVRSDYPIKRLGDRNFTLKVEAQLDDGDNIIVSESEAKVTGRLEIKSEGFFRDAPSSIVNQGPFPPKAGEPTEYTVHWSMVNYSNDSRNVTVKAKLPDYVAFTGVSKSNNDSQPAYNSKSGEVIWEISRISATKGIIGEPLEAVFQISAVPPASSIGRYLDLIHKTSISATDEFTGFPLSAEAPPITSRLRDDKTISEGEGIVR